MNEDKGKVVEVFSSYQGEGIYLGFKQLFIRFAGCNLACAYCDTDFAEFKEYSSLELQAVVESYLAKEVFHSISITGGEPLLQSGFLQKFLPLLKQLGQKVFLETNATLPEALLKVIDYINIVSLDFKCDVNGKIPLLDKHQAFLKIASRKECFVKIVVPPLAKLEPLFQSITIIKVLDSNIALVLQPETGQLPLSAAYYDLINQLYLFAARELKEVRFIPQVHPFLQID